ncbi:MAG: hypothetical protein GWP91_22385 [Rhodobacterales bacterium]|nr:hypothetical protein [Rhodobacterales bacterium]
MQRLPLVWFLTLTGCWVTSAEIDNKANLADTSVDTTTSSTTPSTTSTTTSTSTTTVQTDLDCADEDAGSAVGDAVSSGTNEGASDDQSTACFDGSSDGGLDYAVAWTAPNSGCFGFDTGGTNYDTVLYLLSSCSGDEIVCNDDDSADTNTSYLGYEVTGGDTYLVVVDGYGPTSLGDFQLNVQPGTAIVADQDLGSNTGLIAGSTIGSDDTLDPAVCDYNSGKDHILNWTPPSSGAWTFSLTGATSFDSVLSIHRPCSTDASACADVFSSGSGGGEAITMHGWVGEEFMIRVAGYSDTVTESGNWQLSITGP